MEGQGKRLLIAVGLALGVMLLWNMIFPPEKPPEPPKDGSAATVKVIPAKSKVCVPKPTGDTKPADMKPAEAPDEVITRSFPGKLVAKFSSNGGALVSWVLDDPRYAKDHTKGELLATQKNTGAFRVGFWEGSSKCLPEHQVWTLDKARSPKDGTTVVYTYTYDGIELTKTYTIYP